jgi:hypothetical protein
MVRIGRTFNIINIIEKQNKYNVDKIWNTNKLKNNNRVKRQPIASSNPGGWDKSNNEKLDS